MKVPVNRKRTLLIFFIADLIFAVALFLSCIGIFIFSKWGVLQFVIIGLFVFFSVFMLVLSLTRNFYVIESKYLVVVRAHKEYVYNYADVVYIDEERSLKKKTLYFVTNKSLTRYLPFDKNQEIYKAMMKKCKNLLSEEDFKKQYPNVKL